MNTDQDDSEFLHSDKPARLVTDNVLTSGKREYARTHIDTDGDTAMHGVNMQLSDKAVRFVTDSVLTSGKQRMSVGGGVRAAKGAVKSSKKAA